MSKPGGLNIKKWLQSRKAIRHEIVLTGTVREADLDSVRGKADDVEEETGMCTPRNRRDRGPGTQGRIHRDNVGKVRAAMLVAVLAGESPAGGNCSVATVVISGSGASDQAAGSPEVKVSVGWRETFGQLRQGGERVGRL